MANCKYILELPGGKSIELPASFSTLEESEDINNNFLNYQSELDNTLKENRLKELTQNLRERINISGIHENALEDIIKSSKNINELYSNINSLIYQFGSYENINDAVYNYIKQGSVKGQINVNLKNLMDGLEQQRTPNYFKKIGVKGVLSTTNLQDQKNLIFSKNIRNLECEVSTVITANLNTFMNALIHKYKNTNDLRSNVIYGTNDSFIGSA